MKKFLTHNLKRIIYKDKIDAELLSNHKSWKLIKPLRIIALDKYFIIPKGFITDFASVPKFLKSFFKNEYLYNQITILHDFLYNHASDKYNISRKEADKILNEGIAAINNYSTESLIVSDIFYFSVRLFGKKHWKKDEL